MPNLKQIEFEFFIFIHKSEGSVVSLFTRFEKHKALNFENFVSFGDACSGGGNAQKVITCYEEQYLLGLLSFIQNQLKLFDISCTKKCL